MPKQRRCPYCRRLFAPDPRLKERQSTCGRQECRRNRKRQSNEQWRAQHPDYFHDSYQQQKEVYGTRAEYKKLYRQRNAEYVRRNAAFVQKCRERRRKAQPESVSPTSRDLRLSIWKQTGSISITHESHTSRDIFVSLCEKEA